MKCLSVFGRGLLSNSHIIAGPASEQESTYNIIHCSMVSLFACLFVDDSIFVFW